jgi:ketosteroid isomerase-like protein
MNMTMLICAAAAALGGTLMAADPEEAVAREILALERRAMDGWMKGNPDDDLAITDPAVTYVDPAASGRLEGLPAVRELFEKYRGTPLFDSYEIVGPKIHLSGDIAILSFHFECRNGSVTHRYDSTQVYQRGKEGWRIIHEHWSKAKAQ